MILSTHLFYQTSKTALFCFLSLDSRSILRGGRHGPTSLRTRSAATHVTAVFERYLAQEIGVEHALALFTIRRRQLFTLLHSYRAHPRECSLASTRTAPTRTSEAEVRILRKLQKEAESIRRTSNPVTFYNYRSLQETLAKKHPAFVSLPTIIRRAKKMDIIRSEHSARHMIGKS